MLNDYKTLFRVSYLPAYGCTNPNFRVCNLSICWIVYLCKGLFVICIQDVCDMTWVLERRKLSSRDLIQTPYLLFIDPAAIAYHVADRLWP